MSISNFFKKLFHKKVYNEDQAKSWVTSVQQSDSSMQQAYQNAQQTFPYFWRELSWEYRRIVPALSFACVKVPCAQDIGEEEPLVEHMWINEIDFDGETIKGLLINEPNALTNIKAGDQVQVSPHAIEDWLLSNGEKVCGGYSIQAIRKLMSSRERKEHDTAWGLNFNQDFSVTLTLSDDTSTPHPMDTNMRESLLSFLDEHPAELTGKDEAGNTMLHREAIAGNIESVKVLLEKDADTTLKNNHGKTAKDYAEQYHWQQLAECL